MSFDSSALILHLLWLWVWVCICVFNIFALELKEKGLSIMLAYELSNFVYSCPFSLHIIKVWDINYMKIGNQIKMGFQTIAQKTS